MQYIYIKTTNHITYKSVENPRSYPASVVIVHDGRGGEFHINMRRQIRSNSCLGEFAGRCDANAGATDCTTTTRHAVPYTPPLGYS